VHNEFILPGQIFSGRFYLQVLQSLRDAVPRKRHDKRQQSSGRVQKTHSAGALNNGSVDGASVSVRKGPTLKLIR
jgi:hypothetical protein